MYQAMIGSNNPSTYRCDTAKPRLADELGILNPSLRSRHLRNHSTYSLSPCARIGNSHTLAFDSAASFKLSHIQANLALVSPGHGIHMDAVTPLSFALDAFFLNLGEVRISSGASLGDR